MAGQRLIIVCGVPGSGKSTLAHHAVERWGAVSFASETFAAELGASGRDETGDLTRHAIHHAYAGMGEAVAAALAEGKLVLAVGSFRSEDQRQRFRDIAKAAGAQATTLRVSCAAPTAAHRVRQRMAHGERGPNEMSIRQIEDVLDRASDIDVVLINESSIQDFLARASALLKSLPGL
jgi:predicted kinase